jgi:peroxiredoxin
MWFRFRSLVATVAAIVVGVVNTIARRMGSTVELKPGDVAPDFTLPGSDGRVYRLGDFAGHVVVIAWFPKAFTGG